MKQQMHNLRIKVIFVVIMIASVFALLPMTITAVAPTLSNSHPANGATDVELTPTLRTTVNDPEGDTMNIAFRTNTTGTWGDIGSNNSVYNGTYYQTNSSMNSYSTKYWWSVNCTDGTSWTNTTYNFTTRAQYVPDAPASFTATTVNRTKIDLSWTDDTEADSTRVEWHTADDGSWNPGDYNLLYNGSAESTSDTGLDPGTHHYYKAWSWNNTDNCWSSGSTDDNSTNSNNAPTQTGETPSNGSGNIEPSQATVNVIIEDPDGDTFNWTIQGQYITNTGANGASNGSKSANTITPLPYSTNIIWYVNVTDGSSWTNETYHFTTLDFLWIDVTNATWNLGIVAMESSTWTNETGETFICDMDNTTTNADLSLQITTDGATWKDASTPGDDRYRIYASADNWSSQHLISEDSSATISTITTGQNETFDLRFDAPNSSTTKVQQTITITATIVKH